MKTLIGTELRSRQPTTSALVSPLVLAAMFLWAVAAPGQNSASATNVNTAAVAEEQGASTELSPGIADILKMADAGVSPEVLKAYIETSSAKRRPSGTDIIALKQHKVSDELTSLLIKRGTEGEAAAAQARNSAVAQLLTSRRSTSGGLDPESYQYFQYYYLQPRAMASAYARLAPYYPGFSYGYYHPFVGRPFHPGFGFMH